MKLTTNHTRPANGGRKLRHFILYGCLAAGLIVSQIWRSAALAKFDDPVPLAMRFYPVNVQAGGSMIATIFAQGDMRSAYADVRYRMPGSAIDEVAENWQQGSSTVHSVPADIPAGTWMFTGIRIHQNRTDHQGEFVPVSSPLAVRIPRRGPGTFTLTGPLNN